MLRTPDIVGRRIDIQRAILAASHYQTREVREDVGANSGYLLRSIVPGVVSGIESASDFRGVGFSIRTDTELAVLTRSFRALRLVQYPTELAGSPIRIVCPRTNRTEERFTIKLGVLSHCSARKMAELQNPKIVENEWEHAGHDYHELP